LMQGGWHQGLPVLGVRAVSEMVSSQLPQQVQFGSYTGALAAVAPTQAMGRTFGLGVSIRTRNDDALLPGSKGDFTWPGISGCNFWCDPRRGLVVVQMMQSPSQRFAYRALLRDAIYASISQAPHA
jgi:CubicO group peptidase (beta-lactamase class C family)